MALKSAVFFAFNLLLILDKNECVPVKKDIKEFICHGSHLDIRVAPHVYEGFPRRITIHWDGLTANFGDVMRLYLEDPTLPDTDPEPLFQLLPIGSSSEANCTLDEPNHKAPEELGFQAHCLSVFLTYNGRFGDYASSCLRTEPTWMQDLADVIGTKNLKQIFIPGTHDSSAYKEFVDGEDRITKYSVTQDESVLGQLIYGARYIDLRPAYYANDPNDVWWGNHGVYKFHPLREIFADIKKFLQNTKEIVILDAHEFPYGFGQGDDVHRKFIEYVKEELGDYIVPSTLNWDSTLNEIWATGKQLIFGYNYNQLVPEYDILWPAVSQQWGDVNRDVDLYAYLEQLIANPPRDRIWSAMAQLTPTASDILLDTMGGLRSAASLVNPELTFRFRTKEWASKANIVAVDFLRNTGIVRAAVEFNSQLPDCPVYNGTVHP